jgi:two-component system sensor histidine kinase UhpB
MESGAMLVEEQEAIQWTIGQIKRQASEHATRVAQGRENADSAARLLLTYGRGLYDAALQVFGDDAANSVLEVVDAESARLAPQRDAAPRPQAVPADSVAQTGRPQDDPGAEVESEKDRKHLSALIERHVDTERRRIAHEIHDSLNASVIVIRMYAESIEHMASTASLREIEKHSQCIIAAAHEIYDNMRRISKNLYPEALSALGLSSAIRSMVRKFNESHPHCRFMYEESEQKPTPPPEIAMTAYRIAQEALSNSIKHADASCVMVTLDPEALPRHLRMIISDNGRGFAPTEQTGNGLGLIGMHERVEACSGQLDIVSDTIGTVVTVLL